MNCSLKPNLALVVPEMPAQTSLSSETTKPAPTARDLDAVCARFRAYYARGRFHYAALVKVTPGSQSPVAPEERLAQAKDLLAGMTPDGIWPDIDYDEIFPVWDWKRIPGITCAAAPTLEPQLPGLGVAQK